MLNSTTLTPAAKTTARPAGRLGFWAAAATALVTAVALAIAVGTPPLSGPFCQGGCVVYPYHDVAAAVPRDYYWMYPATLLMPIWLVLMACIHGAAAEGKKLYSLIALVFAAVGAALLAANYYIQIAVLQPSILKGEFDGLALVSQYNPHGVFIALEELGYLLMSLAFLFAGPVFAGRSKLEQALRWLLIGGVLLAFTAYLALTVIYGKDIEYRFEVAVITINWGVLIIAGVLLSFLFRRPAQG